jgi:hypothetical protein
MTKREPTIGSIRPVCIVLSVVALCAMPMWAADTEYLQDDVKISGGLINRFKADGRPVVMVTGDFKLAIGERLVSGRDAVIWIDSRKTGKTHQHDIVVYVEGDAEIIDAGGSKTTDKLMLVRLHVQGQIRMSAAGITQADRSGTALYKRAAKSRADEAKMIRARRTRLAKRDTTKPSKTSAAPRPSERPKPLEKSKPVSDKPAPRGAVYLEELGRGSDNTLAAAEARSKKTPAKLSEPPAKPGKAPTKLSDAPQSVKKLTAPSKESPQALPSVRFSAPGGVTIEKDKKDPNRRISIAKGRVVLTQGVYDSDEYLELRADSAVIFSRLDVKHRKGEEKAPYAPQLIGTSGGGEVITGVYLHGDVIISRGARKMTAPSAYYDFQYEKAIVLEPVFRTIQEQRDIPVIIRASRAEVLSPRETKFYDAIVSSSDFMTPTYSINAKEVTLRDETPYDVSGEQLSERTLSARYRHAWFDLRGVPIMYIPSGQRTFEQGHTSLRKVSTGRSAKFGYGVRSEWHLFRLLGLVKPEGVSARVHADYFEHGARLGVDGDYERREENRQYSGYFKLEGIYDRKRNDIFGDEREVEAPRNERGRILLRHKEFLPRDWQIQGEFSLISDRNFLEEFFPSEFWTAKPQENLIYAKKQRDNWAITALLKSRFNNFLTQTESYPEVAGYLVGQPLLGDLLTYFGEARMGAKRYVSDNGSLRDVRSSALARFDMRHEVDLPLEIPTAAGPLNVVPYVVGRLSYWSQTPDLDQRLRLNNNDADYLWARTYLPPGSGGGDRGDNVRFYGQLGVRANMHFWKIYNDAKSRLWDIHRLKHIVTPELVAFTSATNVGYTDLYPLDPGVEQYIQENTGMSFAVYQRLQTRRGPAGNRRTVDWMRFNVIGGFFNKNEENLKGDGMMMFTHPALSRQRSFIYADYTWNISDSVALLADMHYDLPSGQCDLLNIGVSVQRDPRLKYYAGVRYINQLDSTVGTIGATYKINKKYTISAYEQYDFSYRDGVNLGTRVTITRKMPRWYVSVTFLFDQRYDDGDDRFGLMLTLRPEGVPEAEFGTGRVSLNDQSDEN